MLEEIKTPILQQHKENIAEIFEYINTLIDQNKVNKACSHLLCLHHADLADFLDNSNSKILFLILPKIYKKIVPETIACLNNNTMQSVIITLGLKNAADIINKLKIDDAIEVIDSLDINIKESILKKINKEKRFLILEGLTYPENSVGRVLEKNFIAFQANWTCKEAIEYIRSYKISQDFHAAIIINSKRKPVGNILISTLLKHPFTTIISDLMNKEVKIADTYTTLDELAFIFKQYALTIVPVVNSKGELVGSVSINNMIYIIDEQTQCEFMHLGGINVSDIFANLPATIKQRFPWLFINLITAFFTSLIIDQFSTTIMQLITLATIMPIVASIGGNAGTQAMVVTVRALLNREITKANSKKIILKEIIVCFCNGLFCAVIGAILIYLIFYNVNLSIVFLLAVLISFSTAGLLGSGIPILLNNFDIDPSLASGVFLTACTDALGFFCFLGLSYIFL